MKRSSGILNSLKGLSGQTLGRSSYPKKLAGRPNGSSRYLHCTSRASSSLDPLIESHLISEAPPLKDDDLERLFSDLFTSPPVSRDMTVDTRFNQLKSAPSDPMAVFDALQQRLSSPEVTEEVSSPVVESQHRRIGSQLDYKSAIRRLQDGIEAAEIVDPSSSTHAVTIPLGLATRDEWESLFQQAIDAGDRAMAAQVVDLMGRSGVTPGPTLEDRLLFSYVFAKDVAGVNSYIERIHERQPPTDVQRHMHVQVLVDTRQYQEAQTLIHQYESQGVAPPEATYRHLIQSLFSTPPTSPHVTRHRALAWDLFAHMRYAAHPTPSAETFTTMIRACADAVIPSPERALDLFHEMTVEHRLRPTNETYNAVMLTCARSPKMEYLHQTFLLGQQLFDEYRHMEVSSEESAEAKRQMQPNLDTFKALLESAKRSGDLARARWILAELVHARECVDEGLMAHVFHVYAAYKPPFRRGDVAINKAEVKEALTSENVAEPAAPEDSAQTPEVVKSEAALVPQTHSEVLREADALFNRILNGAELGRWGLARDSSHPDWLFSKVKVTTNLLNAYLAVQCNHSPSEKAAALSGELFRRFGVSRNSQSFATVLEKLATVKGSRSRGPAKEAAEPVWNDWIAFSDKVEKRMEVGAIEEARLSPRRVESLWATMIKIVASTGDTERGIELVKQFEERYPPKAIAPSASSNTAATSAPSPSVEHALTVYSKASDLPAKAFPTRVSLVALQPLVRLTTNLQIPDTAIPPFLAFKDLDVLHHRLVSQSESASTAKAKKQALNGIKYVTWLCRSYGVALGQRRESAIKRS